MAERVDCLIDESTPATLAVTRARTARVFFGSTMSIRSIIDSIVHINGVYTSGTATFKS